MTNVKLITCNGVHYDIDLLEHHIDYYVYTHGIRPENYLLMLNAPNSKNEGLDIALSITKKYNINPHIWIGEYTSQEMHNRRQYILNKNAKKGDWIVHADADEFHAYKNNTIESLIGQLKCASTYFGCDVNYIQGVFIDRLSDDGILKPVLPKISLYEQFPVMCDLSPIWFSDKYPRTALVKMMLYKFGVGTNRGGHTPLLSSAQTINDFPLEKHPELRNLDFRQNYQYRVNHFKWHSRVIDKLQKRVKTYKKRGYVWWKHSQSILDFYNKNGKFPLGLIDRYNTKDFIIGY